MLVLFMFDWQKDIALIYVKMICNVWLKCRVSSNMSRGWVKLAVSTQIRCYQVSLQKIESISAAAVWPRSVFPFAFH